MKIVVLGTRGFPNVQGGIERHCEELYTRLSIMGCRIKVYARKGYVGSRPVKYKGVHILPIWAPRIKSLEAVIHTLFGVLHVGLHRSTFDIVHIHAVGPSLVVPLVRLLGLKVIVTNHGPDYDRQKWGRFAKNMLVMGEILGTRFASNVIAISQHINKNLEIKYKRDSFYIPNGVTLPEKIPSGHALLQYGLKADQYILAVGRFVPEKGFHDLCDAFKQVDTDWKLVIAGEADHESEYSRSLIKNAKEDPRIVLTGRIGGEVLSEIYSNAGLFILPSYHEGLPITILEAMSYDLPVLSSNIPANRELVKNENCTFPSGDIPAMQKK